MPSPILRGILAWTATLLVLAVLGADSSDRNAVAPASDAAWSSPSRSSASPRIVTSPTNAARLALDPFAVSDWHDGSAEYVRIAVVEDGVYSVPRSSLEKAGLPASADPASFRLIENGTEIPIVVDGSGRVEFVGSRNRGTDELWAYNGNAAYQSSNERSLYTDTTYYWLTWGGANGLRYETPSAPTSPTPRATVREESHAEQDEVFYLGRPFESEHPLYLSTEGYYWEEIRHSNVGTKQFETTLDVGRRVASSAETLDLRIKVNSSSASCHRVELFAEILQSGSPTFTSLDVIEWQGYSEKTLTASIPQDQVPASGLRVRLESSNGSFTSSSCPDPTRNPNYVLIDYIEADYTRQLTASGNAQRFDAPTTNATTFELGGYTSGPVRIFHPESRRIWSIPVTNGSASFSDAPSSVNSRYEAIAAGAERAPAAVLSDSPSNWSDPQANGADYVILTTKSLRPSADDLANYRRTQNGFDVAVVEVQDVYDEFDYGRPTPIAIRRFVRASQSWTGGAPRFLTIWGDAQYPIYTDDEIDEVRPSWSVSSFGFPPSDGWFAMQQNGPTDWSELLAVGRVPIRSNEHGRTYLDKLTTYESAPRDRWQQRMLLLAGGTSSFEQQQLQSSSNRWGERATRRSTPQGDTLYPAGMDSIRYYKSINDPLDVSFQDSLAQDLRQGVGWLNYFGHSAAQTWEIVTDPPSEFDNAGRLPMVVSLGCRTGSFAGGRYEVRSAPSLGEQLVVGSVNASGQVEPGAENGSIAHWGSSALGNLRPSAILNDALINRVFRDTMRVLGVAIQQAKADVAASYGGSPTYVRHLLQYSLLGDPATRLSLPDQPDFHLEASQIRTSPSAPTPSNSLQLEVSLQNRGLVPSDSVDLYLQWSKPDGSVEETSRRLPRFALQTEEYFSLDLSEATIGTNTLELTADPLGQIPEMVESDNRAENSIVVFSQGLELVSPVRQETVSKTSPTFRVNLVRQTPGDLSVDIQVDTTASFSSPALQSTSQSTSNVYLDWTPPEPLIQDQPYYWRARIGGNSPGVWKSAAFSVAPNQPADWRQFSNLFDVNGNQRVVRENNTWSFSTFSLNVKSYGQRSSSPSDYGFNVGGSDSYIFLGLGYGVLVIDGTSGEVKAVDEFTTYDLQTQFEYALENGEMQEAIDALRAFLDTNVDAGDYVFVQTRHLGRESSFGVDIQQEVKDLFKSLGSGTTPTPYTTYIDTLEYTDAWTLSARKGDPSFTREQVLPAGTAGATRQIMLERNLPFRRASGTTVTPLIGPASDWTELRWKGSTSASSNIEVEVLAPDSTRLLGPFSGDNGTEALSSLDADTYPYLRLRGTLSDTVQRDAPQLDRWEVDFTGVPEIAVDPATLATIADTVQQGDNLPIDLPVINLGDIASSDVVVTYRFTGSNNIQRVVRRDTLTGLAPNEQSQSQLQLSTQDVDGLTLLDATASIPTVERLTFNNTAVRNLRVVTDDTPPVLSVFSDGRQLQARPTVDDLNLKDARLPFVPLQPTLEIRIEDENPFFAIDDTSHVEVYISEGLPSTDTGFLSTYEQVGFATNLLEFSPSNPNEGVQEATVTYTPDFTGRDSTYTLRVEAKDGSDNEIDPYEVSFRVTTEQRIRDVYPYPNPMSTNTTFAFRVEGGQTQDLRNFRLRIYTVAGRLIREFDERDLQTGSLRVGWNMLPWDGRDEDGDRVATGVYLYRVAVEGADGTFTGDVEKVAVIR
ncbi:C25 family cysteine peptidase [Longibacter salinarum]|nr:C25 family cysteine peptidase [Longibacter salinarum]